jgi:Domain of unknown function (DUF2017)
MTADPFRRTSTGDFLVELRAADRELLRSVAVQLRETITGTAASDDPAVARLFPPAYPDDPLRNLDFEHLVADDLMRDRLEGLAVLERTAGATRISEDDLLRWMRAANDARLVLGTRLDVREDSDLDDFKGDDDTEGAFAVYTYLSALVASIVDALGNPTP